ncbi:MAG TPA: TraR/DksA family transcriptional regulator [Terriglobales bacterium]|nr:TraR/DksA family transcriptional regulator [Terriglobales bacterium]
MDAATKESLRKKLEESRTQFSQEAARKAEAGREAGSDAAAADIVDRAVTTYMRELNFSQSENETQLLQMVNGALQRMDDGTYGQCLNCGREIGLKRLEAVPWTHLCIECQTKAEEIDQSRRSVA